MKIDDANMAWALKKLNQFRGWRGFPQNEEDLNGRARSFLRLVHGKPIREIVEGACRRNHVPEETIAAIDWDAKGMDPNQNDADWILDYFRETGDFFPLPIEMRRVYKSKLPPASTFGDELQEES